MRNCRRAVAAVLWLAAGAACAVDFKVTNDSPTIVYDAAGRVTMLTGSPGGSAIVGYVVKTLVAMIDWGLDPQAAAALGNFGSRNGPTELEAGTPVAALAPKLRAMGHDVRVGVETSGVQAIARTRSGWIGGADPRREGVVRGR